MAFYNGNEYTGIPEITEVWHDRCFIPVYGPQFASNSGQQPYPWRWSPVWADSYNVNVAHCPGCNEPVVGTG
jgi:hypothetical protein